MQKRMLLDSYPSDDACTNSSTGVANAPSRGPPRGRNDMDCAGLGWIRTGWRYRYGG